MSDDVVSVEIDMTDCFEDGITWEEFLAQLRKDYPEDYDQEGNFIGEPDECLRYCIND